MELIAIDKERGSRLAAEIVANRLRAFPDLVLALPTGESPSLFYEHLRNLSSSSALQSSSATLIQLDEYLGRESGWMQRDLANFLRGIPWRERYVIRDENYRPPDADLMVLGIGRNGHLAFSEPGQLLSSDFGKVLLSEETRGQNKVTATEALSVAVPYIKRSREIILIAWGESKARALAQGLLGPIHSDSPLSLLRDHPRLTVICDQEAAALMGKRALSYKRAVVALGCRDQSGYSPVADSRARSAARVAARLQAGALVFSGGVLSGRDSEADRMRASLGRKIPSPLLLEEASLQTSDHLHLLRPFWRALGTREIVLVSSWWHIPRLFVMHQEEDDVCFRPAWSGGAALLPKEIQALLWARSDLALSSSRKVEAEEWQIRGSGLLEGIDYLGGREGAERQVALALERSESEYDFDSYLEGIYGGRRLSGSQLLWALDARAGL